MTMRSTTIFYLLAISQLYANGIIPDPCDLESPVCSGGECYSCNERYAYLTSTGGLDDETAKNQLTSEFSQCWCLGADSDYDTSGPSLGRDWTLVFEDEFDTLDTSKWYLVNAGGGFGNNEKQYYTPNNAKVEGGRLVISAERQSTWWGGSTYTSAKLQTHASWTYGRMEIRAKLPRGRGTWPAIWTLPKTKMYGNWPNSGEIDIMEHVGYDMGNVHGTIHTGAFNHMKGTQKGGSVDVSDCADVFHNYQITWTEDAIRWYVDDVIFFQVTKEEGWGSYEWPFDISHYLILNVAVGGNWGGAQGIDNGAFPTTMEVEYVKIWQEAVNAGVCDEQNWPDIDNGQICGDCKVLVDNFQSTYGTCNGYCTSIGRTCVGAWDEVTDTCQVLETMTCDQTLESSDAICECGPVTDSDATPEPTPATVVTMEPTPAQTPATCDENSWPDLDGGLVCGECKVLVNNFDSVYGTCNGYCGAMGMACKGAWEEVGDTCEVLHDMTCDQTIDSSDAICECDPSGEPAPDCGAPINTGCMAHITWADNSGKVAHPDWYPDFSTVTGVSLSDSTTEDMSVYFACRDTGHAECVDIELPCGRSCGM